MRVTPVSRPAFHPAIDARVDKDVQDALNAVTTVGTQFIVNDSLWYAVNDRQRVTPCVVNQADFISKSFQRQLQTRGWQPEATIDGQTIDALLEFQVPTPLPTIGVDDADCIDFVRDYLTTPDGKRALAQGETKGQAFARLHDAFVRRSSVVAPSSLDVSLHKYLKARQPKARFFIGLEFETGNIASSFRALLKLSNLYRQDRIDGGVFVTAIDKANCATRIWPVSNRNGSFEELQRRNYKSDLSLPLWEYGFAPDAFSRTAPYLASNGTIYAPQLTGRTVTVSGTKYAVFLMWDGKEIVQ